MTFTHALSTNNYGPAKFIVATAASNGTHTTLASAMAAASAGDTIFLRDSVTENVTLTPGVNIVGPTGQIGTNQPTITGKLTMTGAGTCIVENICLTTNSDFVIAVTGSAASILNLFNCYLNCTNNTGISFTSSSGSSSIFLENTNGDLGTTGIAYYSMSAAGTLRFAYGRYNNSGSLTTASSNSAGDIHAYYIESGAVFSTSSTGTIEFFGCILMSSGSNTTILTTAGTGTGGLDFCALGSGSASAISIGSGTTVTVNNCRITSSNTNAITGAGTLLYSNILYGNSNVINTTTQTAEYINLGKSVARGQPAFLAYPSANITNVTGDGTAYTVIWNTTSFDLDSNFNTTTGTFTAPIAGKYQFNLVINVSGMSAGTTSFVAAIVASGGITYRLPTNVFTAGINSQDTCTGSVLINLAASETVTTTVTVGGGTKTANVVGNPASTYSSHWSGYLVA